MSVAFYELPSLDTLIQSGALAGYSPPQSPFDPAGPWEHRYTILSVQANKLNALGSLRLIRSAAADEKPGTLQVEKILNQTVRGFTHQTTAVIRFLADSLATPRSWQLEHRMLQNGVPVPDTLSEESGKLSGNKLQVSCGDRTSTRSVTTPVTSNWSLFDAVQRLAGPQTTRVQLGILEEMDLVKAQCQLSYWKARTVTLGGNRYQLKGCLDLLQEWEAQLDPASFQSS